MTATPSRYWPSIVIGGAPLDLAHLDPVSLRCPTPGTPAELVIDVRFSVHCFTEAFDGARHDPAVKIMDHKQARAFDPARYGLSHHLPAIVGRLPAARVHQTPERRNYVHYAALAELAGGIYQMFFSLRRAQAGRAEHLAMFVESAYPAIGESPTRRRPAAIRFPILALKIYRGESVRFAAR